MNWFRNQADIHRKMKNISSFQYFYLKWFDSMYTYLLRHHGTHTRDRIVQRQQKNLSRCRKQRFYLQEYDESDHWPNGFKTEHQSRYIFSAQQFSLFEDAFSFFCATSIYWTELVFGFIIIVE